MQIIETGFDGLYILQPRIFTDSRGYFFESYKLETFLKAGIPFHPVQDNESKSAKGVIRGLHYQLEPFAQTKLIRVVVGKIFDVAVDIRQHSKTYGRWFGIELDSENKMDGFISFKHAVERLMLSPLAGTFVAFKMRNPMISFVHPLIKLQWFRGYMDSLKVKSNFSKKMIN